MGKKVISYTLTLEGAVPEFIEAGGFFYNNGVLVGITKSDVEYSAIQVFNNVDELQAYLQSFIVDSYYPLSRFPSYEGQPAPFDHRAEASKIFEIANL